jgi:hypothetical protein
VHSGRQWRQRAERGRQGTNPGRIADRELAREDLTDLACREAEHGTIHPAGSGAERHPRRCPHGSSSGLPVVVAADRRRVPCADTPRTAARRQPDQRIDSDAGDQRDSPGLSGRRTVLEYSASYTGRAADSIQSRSLLCLKSRTTRLAGLTPAGPDQAATLDGPKAATVPPAHDFPPGREQPLSRSQDRWPARTGPTGRWRRRCRAGAGCRI